MRRINIAAPTFEYDSDDPEGFRFPGEAGGAPSASEYPKQFTVDYVRGYRRVE